MPGGDNVVPTELLNLWFLLFKGLCLLLEYVVTPGLKLNANLLVITSFVKV